MPNWYDYRTADLVLAVRDLTEQDARTKPASKLVNAWMQACRRSSVLSRLFKSSGNRNWTIWRSEVPPTLDAIQRLKSQPGLYEQMIANGLQRAEDYSTDRMVQRWVDILSGPVAEHYRRWLKEGRAARLARFPVRAVRQKLAYRSALYHRDHGYRIVSGRVT